MVTIKLYAPAAVKVAVVFFAALVPLTLKLTGAGTVPNVAQVYVRFASPLGSAPRTLRFVVVEVTGAGLADAVAATVGPATTSALEITVAPLVGSVTVTVNP